MTENNKNNKSGLIIGIVSVVLVAVVAALYGMTPSGSVDKQSILFLPKLHAFLNSATAVCLLVGGYFIRVKKDQLKHRNSMMLAFVLSSLFLISYVIYHYLAPSTSYGGQGTLRTIYYFVLITHILLSIIIVPLVLFSFYFALTKQFERHKKIVKWTMPLWLYVAISGVTVYFMISPYY
ncbi:MAG: DUF420 domain-containing protein [Cyclobacteriaceae bacterium]